MKSLKKRITNTLMNESGGPSVEQIIGIGVAICIGVGLYKFGGKIFDWLTGAGDVVDGLEKQKPEAGPWGS